MLDNFTYDKVKLIYQLSKIIWFIEKHSLIDANNTGDKESLELIASLKKDLEKYLEKIQKSVCIISQ